MRLNFLQFYHHTNISTTTDCGILNHHSYNKRIPSHCWDHPSGRTPPPPPLVIEQGQGSIRLIFRHYLLLSVEHKAMKEYINEGLEQGYIRSSNTSTAVSFFKQTRREKGCPYSIDNSGLNISIVKYPLLQNSFEVLITSKDGIAYNFVQI